MEEYNYTEEDLNEFLIEGVKLAKRTGELIKSAIVSEKNVTLKASGEGYASSVLTETDKEVEDIIVLGLSKAFSDHEFIGEEGVSEEGEIKSFSNKPTWIIDPIDGTMNFIHKNPLVCTSMALAINRRVVLGIVNCPIINQLYTSIKGKGSFLNDERIKVSGCNTAENAMVITELSCGGNTKKKAANVESVKKLLDNVQAIRAPGPAALDMCWVGAGSADCFFHFGIHCWDMAAGALIIREAGGYVMDPCGGEFDIMSKRCLFASSKALAEEIKEYISVISVEREFPDACPL